MRVERAEKNVTTGKYHHTSKSFISTTHDKSVNKKQFKCSFCNEAHTIYQLSLRGFSANYRRKASRLTKYLTTNYFLCLSTMHMINKCSSKSSCRICQKRHHSLLHLTTSTSITRKFRIKQISMSVKSLVMRLPVKFNFLELHERSLR